MSYIIRLFAWIILLGAVCSACSQANPSPQEVAPTPMVITPTPTTPIPSLVITNVSIVDVENGTLIPNQTVLIQGELIWRIGNQGTITIPQGTQTISGDGLYLMPGLVDAHVHYFDPDTFGNLMIANGVLFVRDMGLPTEFILPLRDSVNRGEVLGPEMVTTGTVLDGVPPIIPSISQGVQTPEEGRAAVQSLAAAGVDMIKVYSLLKEDVFLAILDEADQLGLKVVGHVPDSIYLEDAALSGMASSEHLFGFEKAVGQLLGEPLKLYYYGMGAETQYLDRLNEVAPQELQDFYERIRTSGLTVCPTIIVFKAGTQSRAFQSGNFPKSEYISSKVLDIWRSQWSGQSDLEETIWQNWAKMVKGLNQAGVPMMVGTDLLVPGIIPGFSVHDEMEIWQQAGIPSLDILRSATIIPYQFIGVYERTGSITEGKQASMVLLRSNPLEDVRNTREIEGVFLHGRYFDQQDIQELIEDVQSAVEK